MDKICIIYYIYLLLPTNITSVESLWRFQRDDMEAIPGYLSLHQTAELMTLKWTPNQLMNGSVGDLEYERRCKFTYL